MREHLAKLSAMVKLKILILIAVFAATAVSQGAAREEEATKRPVLVELFTSQGCSSCPPADRLLQDLGRQPDIIAISWPINYWDYLGWADTFAEPQFTERQKAYQQTLNRHYVYTPQMVIDGRQDIVGSKEAEVRTALKSARAAKVDVPVSLRREGGQLIVALGDAADGAADTATAAPATVWLVHLRRHAAVTVEKGENAGRRLEYAHVARAIRKIGEWQGAAQTITIPETDLWVKGSDGCAVIVQEGAVGPVLGAAQLYSTREENPRPATRASGR